MGVNAFCEILAMIRIFTKEKTITIKLSCTLYKPCRFKKKNDQISITTSEEVSGSYIVSDM